MNEMQENGQIDENYIGAILQKKMKSPSLPANYRWPDFLDGFLVTDVPTGCKLELSDVITHVNQVSVGLDHTSSAVGDILWYLEQDRVHSFYRPLEFIVDIARMLPI